MALIEQALINSKAVNPADMQQEAPHSDDKYSIGRYFNKSSE